MFRALLHLSLAAALLAGSTLCCCVAQPRQTAAPPACCCCDAHESTSKTPSPPPNVPCTCKQKQPLGLPDTGLLGGALEAKALPGFDLTFTLPVLLVPQPPMPELAALPSGWFTDSQDILRALRTLRL